MVIQLRGTDSKMAKKPLDNSVDDLDRMEMSEDEVIFQINFDCLKKNQDYRTSFTVPTELGDKTKVTSCMTKSSEHHHLKDSVIISALTIKWLRAHWTFWTNLIFYTTFILSLALYFLISEDPNFVTEEKSTLHNISVQISRAFLITTLILVILRELSQFYEAPMTYLTRFEHYVKVTQVILTAIIVFNTFVSSNTSETLYCISILLAAFVIILMVGNHPFFSTYKVYFGIVPLHFYTFLVWCILLMFFFALCFFIFTNNAVGRDRNSNETALLDFKSTNVGGSVFNPFFRGFNK